MRVVAIRIVVKIKIMKKTIQYIIGCWLMMVTFQSQAQQLPVMHHYVYNPYLYNPSRAGQEEMTKIDFHFKKQWVNMPESPITGILGVDARIPGTDMGVGAMFYMDQMHIINRIGGMASYAYHIPFSKKIPHRLSLGVSLGFIHQRFNFEQATVSNTADLQILLQESEGTAFDFSAGLNYRIHGLNVGISMLQGLNNGLLYLSSGTDNISFVNTRHFIGNASYRFAFGAKKNIYLEPSVLVRFIPEFPVQVEANLMFGWNKVFWLGAGYRSSNNEFSTSAIMATAAVEIGKHVFVAYTFEIGVNDQLNNSLGTQHEFMVGVRFGGSKKLKELEDRIEALETQDSLFKDDIAASKAKEEDLQRQIDSLGNEINDQQDAQDKMSKDMETQSQWLNDKDKEIQSNTKEIERLRELIRENPMQYKKIGSVYFEKGSDELTPETKKVLALIKDAIAQEKSSAMVYLYGNASIEGDQTKNMNLSTERTIAVRKELLRLGVQNEVLVLPMGEENPVEGATENVDEKDRRVDVIIGEKMELGKKGKL